MYTSKKVKERVYTFRHNQEVYALLSVSEEKLKDELIESCLSKGYIPAYFKYQRYENDHSMWCVKAYAGKKTARIIYEKNKDNLEKMPHVITLNPPKKKK